VDNARFDNLKFDVARKCVLHGFSGYFETVLYKHITLSINPETHTPKMFSWFSLYFPIKDPMFLKEGDTLSVNFWRRVGRRDVWYEWAIDSPRATMVHNPGGRSYKIGL